MFKLVSERTAWWPVKWMAAADEGVGEVEEKRIDLQFRLIDEDALAALPSFGDKIDDEMKDASRSERTAAVMIKIIADWKGVGDESGVALPFSQVALGQLVAMPGLLDAITTAYRKCRDGEGSLRAKN